METRTNEDIEEVLKVYMESAGKEDAVITYEDIISDNKKVRIKEEDIEETLKGMTENLEHDWSYYGFNFLGGWEDGYLSDVIPKRLSEEEVHDMVVEAFYEYYVRAFISKFRTLAEVS